MYPVRTQILTDSGSTTIVDRNERLATLALVTLERHVARMRKIPGVQSLGTFGTPQGLRLQALHEVLVFTASTWAVPGEKSGALLQQDRCRTTSSRGELQKIADATSFVEHVSVWVPGGCRTQPAAALDMSAPLFQRCLQARVLLRRPKDSTAH